MQRIDENKIYKTWTAKAWGGGGTARTLVVRPLKNTLFCLSSETSTKHFFLEKISSKRRTLPLFRFENVHFFHKKGSECTETQGIFNFFYFWSESYCHKMQDKNNYFNFKK